MTQWFVFLVFGGLGGMLLFVGATQWRLQHRLMRHAQPVTARIVRAELHSSQPRDDEDTVTHRAEVRFRYQCQGRSYESDLMHPTVIVQGHGSRSAAEDELRAYPPGATVVAYVDPAHPDKGFLKPQASVGPMVFTVLGLLLPPLAWLIGGWL